ncbi:hypothetical protein HQO38_03170 [Rhodococcus fascians]|uniref:Secreted protein n=1 Tax=Rhodococcoides fascians TaxID=1828 RepID=A0A143QKS7_RHOFA|nr:MULTISPECIES: hypothetical protein [Rhodococcus]MDP9636065.1 hypothetical protein [Rhodococcus cercidiphylli]RZL69973.1 MAG: hypothetical protein EOP29_24670 [Rhodococcus sp. (in: high G+C Gram-positive bacteria)]AMY23509.1 hypothetical protein A3Q41_02207 [Rhodococcus fascians]KJV03408.1 hypothetical protein VF34_01397 [Rhodococcus sp. PML026]KMJ50476.1 hypothetical protein ACG96_06625 [Rhodococcus fascians]
MKIRNKAVVTATALASSVALATLVAGPANAADTLPITFQADTTTVIAKTGQPVVFPTTALATDVDLVGGTVTGTLALPQASADLKLGPATLANFTISIVDATPVSGTIAAGGPAEAPQLELNVAQSFKIRIDSVKPLGIGGTGSSGSAALDLIPPGSNCVTSETTANLTGALDAIDLIQNNEADTHVKGTYTIPQFQNCGTYTSLLNGLIAGPNNTLDVHLTNPVFDVGTQQAIAAKVAL